MTVKTKAKHSRYGNGFALVEASWANRQFLDFVALEAFLRLLLVFI